MRVKRSAEHYVQQGRLLLLFGTMVGGGCSGPESGVEFTSRDSAGVAIGTTSRQPGVWRTDDEPLLQLGSVDESGPTQFFRIVDIALLRDGGVAVANQGSEEIRVFGPDGAHRGTAGGRGSGPEEFSGLQMIAAFGDSLLTWDGGNARISVRRADGSFARGFRLEWHNGILFPVALVDADVSQGRRPGILAVTARYMSELNGSGLVVDTALVSLYDMQGSMVDSLARVPHNSRAVRRVGNRQTTLGVPYVPNASIEGYEDGFCYTFGPDAHILCHGPQRLKQILRVDIPDRPVTERDVARYWDEAFKTQLASRRSALNRMRDVMPFPDRFPAFAQLLRDDTGRLWARRYPLPTAEEEEWLVFDNGKWIGGVASPLGFRVMDVRGRRLAGVWRDSVGVEYVRIYRYKPGND